MNRILFEPAEIAPDGCAVLEGERAEHVRAVLHGTVGQTLKTGVVGGRIGTAVITGLAEGKVFVRTCHDTPPLPPWCDLVLAPPRPRVMKRLLPQLATLGVRRIFLVGAEKVEKAFWGAQLLKEELYRPLLVEGLMQGAVATEVPTVNVRKNLRHWFDRGGFEAHFTRQPFRVIAHPPSPGAPAAVRAPEAVEADGLPVFAIGPEGGWTDAEVALFAAHGFACQDLGPRILKTETAACALLARFMRTRC